MCHIFDIVYILTQCTANECSFVVNGLTNFYRGVIMFDYDAWKCGYYEDLYEKKVDLRERGEAIEREREEYAFYEWLDKECDRGVSF